MEDLTKTIMFTTNALQNGTPTTIQYQTSDGTLKPKIEGQKGQEFPTFCYTTNVNKIQMLTPTSQVMLASKHFLYSNIHKLDSILFFTIFTNRAIQAPLI